MCSYLTLAADVSGGAKGADGWFALTRAVVSFDHPWFTPADHTLNIDFLNPAMGPSARMAVELTPASARALVECISAALETGRDAG